MATEVDICNMGLARLGANLITTFDDGTTEANLCKLQYPFLRNMVLTARAWTFATSRKQLASGVPPDPIPAGWGYAYLVPDDCLRVIQLYIPNATSSVDQWQDTQFDSRYITISWERLKDYLYANNGPTLWCKYVTLVEDTGLYDVAFIDALSAKIAMELAMPITNNPTILDGMTRLYAAKLVDASSTEGQQGTSQVIQQPGTLVARRV